MPPATITTSSPPPHGPPPTQPPAPPSPLSGARGSPTDRVSAALGGRSCPFPGECVCVAKKTSIKGSGLISTTNASGQCPSPRPPSGHRRLADLIKHLYTCIFAVCVLKYILVLNLPPFHICCGKTIFGPPAARPISSFPFPPTAVRAYAWVSSLPAAAAFFFFLGARRGCAMRFLSSSSCNDLEDETLSL